MIPPTCSARPGLHSTKTRARAHDSQPKRASYYALRADTAATRPCREAVTRNAPLLARLKAFPPFPFPPRIAANLALPASDLAHLISSPLRLPPRLDRRRAPPRLTDPIRAWIGGQGATRSATYRFLPLNWPQLFDLAVLGPAALLLSRDGPVLLQQGSPPTLSYCALPLLIGGCSLDRTVAAGRWAARGPGTRCAAASGVAAGRRTRGAAPAAFTTPSRSSPPRWGRSASTGTRRR